MKDQLKALWNAPTAWASRSAWTQWLRHARESGIPALMHFAKCLRPYWRGILSRMRCPMHTGLVDGINNRINVIKPIAYGYRADAYFFRDRKRIVSAKIGTYLVDRGGSRI